MGAVDVVVALVAVKEVCFNRAATSNGGGAGAVDFAAFAVGHDAGGDLLVGGALVVEVAGVFVNFIQKCVAGGDLAELAGGVSPFHEEGAAWILFSKVLLVVSLLSRGHVQDAWVKFGYGPGAGEVFDGLGDDHGINAAVNDVAHPVDADFGRANLAGFHEADLLHGGVIAEAIHDFAQRG